VRVPSLRQHLASAYNWFYVYNGPQSWFFPRWFYKNNGIRVYGKDELMPKGTRRKWGPGPHLGLNESQLTDFFIKKLNATSEPFGAVYHSFVAHYPYFDYGPEYD